jgi:hypothetical protein
MRIGLSLFLIALGAILKFAVSAKVSGVSLDTVGVILMVVGVIGLLITIVLMATRQRTDVVQSDGRTTVMEPRPTDPSGPVA